MNEEGKISYEAAAEKESPLSSRLRDYREKPLGKRGPMDVPLLLLTLLLLAIGLVMVLSASFARAYYTSGNAASVFVKQLSFSAIGFVVMILASRLRTEIYHRFAFPALIASVLLLALVPFIGSEEGGATRWINLGFTNVQPSEIVKLAMILAFAHMICIYKEKMQTFKYGVLPFGIIMVLIVGLLLLEPHVSASVIIIAVGAVMMFAGGTKLRWFAGVGTVVGAAGVVIVTKFPHASARVQTWLDPFADTSDAGYQIVQSLYSIGSGGLLGLGLGQSRQKYLYLPEEHNDFIFSVVCEELGYIGALLILALFAVLIVRGYWIAVHARNRFDTLVATGITTLLALQVFLNVAVVTNLIPCTGISLPFFSYGGTALLMQMLEMGILLSISRDIPVRKAG